MWLAALTIVVAACLYLYFDTLKPKKFPPGPKWVPILGCASEVYKLREKTGYLYKAVKELSLAYSKDGSLLGLRIGKDRIVMVNSLEANKEMLYNEDIDGRPKGIFYQTRTWGERRGVLLTDGELWKEQRRFLLRHLKEFGFGRRGMEDIARLEASHMVHDVFEIVGDNDGKPAVIQMHNFFNVYILNTLWTMMAGIRYKPSDPQMKVLQSLLFDLFAAVDMVGTLFSHFPILSILTPTLSGYKDFIRTHKRIWKFLREELARHKNRFDSSQEDRDFMDVYIRVLKERGEVDSYSEGQLVAMCMDMFMAGTETTSKSMSFCFSYLVREQDVQNKAQEEIDRIVGKDRTPTLDDRPNMPYNEAIVHECVRHFMGRTFGVPHRALRDTSLAGYFIPESHVIGGKPIAINLIQIQTPWLLPRKNDLGIEPRNTRNESVNAIISLFQDTMVLSNFTNILMDEHMFPEPYSFKPERFISEGKLSLPDHYFPFGLAKHRCMGDVLAKCNIFIFTTTMLQKFSFLPAPEEPLPSLDHVDGATPSAAPFKALVVPRE